MVFVGSKQLASHVLMTVGVVSQRWSWKACHSLMVVEMAALVAVTDWSWIIFIWSGSSIVFSKFGPTKFMMYWLCSWSLYTLVCRCWISVCAFFPSCIHYISCLLISVICCCWSLIWCCTWYFSMMGICWSWISRWCILVLALCSSSWILPQYMFQLSKTVAWVETLG